MPGDTVIDGEVVELDSEGRPSFIHSRTSPREQIPTTSFSEGPRAPSLLASVLDAGPKDLIHSVRAQGLEGLVAKRRDSRYEPEARSGRWQKMRVFGATFDALVFVYFDGRPIYAARTPNGITRHVAEIVSPTADHLTTHRRGLLGPTFR